MVIMVLIQIPDAYNYKSKLSAEPEKTALTVIHFYCIQAKSRDFIIILSYR